MTKPGPLDYGLAAHLARASSFSLVWSGITYDSKVPAPSRPLDSDNLAGNSVRSLRGG